MDEALSSRRGWGDVILILSIVLQKPTEQWTRERVLRWLGDIGMEKYGDKFKGVSGKVMPPHATFPPPLTPCRASPIIGGLHGDWSSRLKRTHFLLISMVLYIATQLERQISLSAAHWQSCDVQRLLQLSRADIDELVDLRVDADLLTDAINELRLRDVSPPPSPPNLAYILAPFSLYEWPEISHLLSGKRLNEEFNSVELHTLDGYHTLHLNPTNPRIFERDLDLN